MEADVVKLERRQESVVPVSVGHDRLSRRAFLRSLVGIWAGLIAVAPRRRAFAGAAPSTNAKRTRTLYRLSSRRQRQVCHACKLNDAHSYYRTILVADGDRAHRGCRCRIVPQSVPVDRYKRYFAPHHRNIFDDRWVKSIGAGG